MQKKIPLIARAVDFDSQEPLYVKALAWESKMPFDMNFQQVKPKCCDVFDSFSKAAGF